MVNSGYQKTVNSAAAHTQVSISRESAYEKAENYKH